MKEELNRAVWLYLETLCPGIQEKITGLSPRELDVLLLLGENHTSSGIGRLLGLSSKTVDCYRSLLRRSLGVDGRVLGVVASLVTFREWMILQRFETIHVESEVI